MGQKVNPIGFRLCTHGLHDSIWYTDGAGYAKGVAQDYWITSHIERRFAHIGVAKVVIKRKAAETEVIIYCSKPGLIIGKKGADLEILKAQISKKLGSVPLISVLEVRKPKSSAVLIARSIAFQLEKRSSFRRVIKKTISTVIREPDVKGIKVACSGRLSGAEIARTETFKEGSIPLHTLRADVDYYIAEAHTTYGVIGVKVWIYRGDVFRA